MSSSSAVNNLKTHKISIQPESFYLLSFVSWLHHFKDISLWEFRAGNNGVFAIFSCLFLMAQTLVLFDLGKLAY